MTLFLKFPATAMFVLPLWRQWNVVHFQFKIYNNAVTSQTTIKQRAYGSGKKSKLRNQYIFSQGSLALSTPAWTSNIQ